MRSNTTLCVNIYGQSGNWFKKNRIMLLLLQDPGVPGGWGTGQDEQEAGEELDRCREH